MSGPPLIVTDAGRGTTPPCPDAQFARGDVEGDPKPYLAQEKHLLPSGKPKVEIGTIREEPE